MKIFYITMYFLAVTYAFLINKGESISMTDNLILVNKSYSLDSDFVPTRLVKMTNVEVINNKELLIVDYVDNYYIKLYKEALKNNIKLVVFSAYRSYEYQQKIYTGNNMYSALPGYSEHQTGLALDISTKYYGLNTNLGQSVEGKWLHENMHKYGFILRYPKNKSHITGYFYEPWHIRFVGLKEAKIIFENELTLEEYIKNENI